MEKCSAPVSLPRWLSGLSHSAHRPGYPVFITAKYERSGGDNWNCKSCNSSQIIINQQTNTQFFFTGRMPFLPPNQQCQTTDGKSITFHGPANLKLTWGLPTLSSTTNSSWLPCGRVAMPLISPLIPVPYEQQRSSSLLVQPKMPKLRAAKIRDSTVY